MTIIAVTTPENRFTVEQRRLLAKSLTDAVLVPEVGQNEPAARVGFQVHFIERSTDRMAIGGRLLSEISPVPDVILVNILVMNAAWPLEVRKAVIEGVLAHLAEACGMDKPAPTWWVTFQVIEEGSWGSSGGVLSILDLLDSGVFTADRAALIRGALTD